MNNNRQSLPSFLITIDTEGDNLWSHPQTITTQNSQFLPRFQECCEQYGFKPTYLVNYEMAKCPVFQEFGHDILKRNQAEIGMHLHAWNSPPISPLTPNDFEYMPYLIEYPKEAMREKIAFMTSLLEDTFQTKMISHRAGRWAFNEIYASILAEHGYHTDCSVTPHLSWSEYSGDPNGNGGTDYTHFLEDAYFLDLNNIRFAGDSSLLEIPVTILQTRWNRITSLRDVFPKGSLPYRAWGRLFPSLYWLRPNGNNQKELLSVLKMAIRQKKQYVEFMLHSSELMPGGSPAFPTENAIESLYETLHTLFEYAQPHFRGATLSDFYHSFTQEEDT